MSQSEYAQVETLLRSESFSGWEDRFSDSLSVDGQDLRLQSHIEHFSGLTGAEIIIASIALPAIYVLKKVSDKAVDRFATIIVEKLADIFRTRFGSRIQPSEVLWAGRIILLLSIRDNENPEPICDIRMTKNLKGDTFSTQLLPLIRFLLNSSLDGKMPALWVVYWDSQLDAWLIEGTGYAYRPSDSVILKWKDSDG